jgi:hypothetical protein
LQSAIVVTLGATLGGLATDFIAPRPRRPSLRRWLIDTLSKGIRQGTTGPLRLVEREDGLYVIGCGLSHRVDSVDEAGELVGDLLREVGDMLGECGFDMAAEACATETNEDREDDVVEYSDVEDTHWEEWPEPAEAASQEQAVVSEPETKSNLDESPETVVVAIEAPQPVAPPQRLDPKQPRKVGVEEIDQVLSDIVSHMRACCAAASSHG